MLNLVDNAGCRFSRRSFLQIGSLALGGLTLPDLLATRALASSMGQPIRDKAVVLLFLQGGPPQHETFDPKMAAPAEVRSTTGEVRTRLPGVTFGGTFPQMANIADRLAVVRSFASRNGGHEYDSTVSGGFPLRAAMSAIYARLAGVNHPVTGMPKNVIVVPEAVKDGLSLGAPGGTGALSGLTTPGSLGPRYDAFNPAGGTNSQVRSLMELRMPRTQFDDRRALVQRLDSVRNQLDASGIIERFDRHHQQAFDVILRGIATAFDLSQEDHRVLARYDTSRLFRMEDWWRYGNLARTTNLLGKQLLLARRLIERGCGFVTISDCGWDMHADHASAPGMTAMVPLGGQVDHAVAAFLEDIRQRGLEDRILLIVTGEMGRTPRLNANGGREHWGDLTPLVLAGGGLKMGQVIGESDRQGGVPVTQPYTPANLVATVMHYLFDVPQFRLRSDLPAGIKDVIENGTPIGPLFEA